MPMLHLCAHHGCETLTLGRFCIAHEEPVEARLFPRGRPFPPADWALGDPVPDERAEPVRGFA